MNTFRKIIAWILAFVFGLLVTAFSWSVIVTATIGNRTTIKNWLSSSGTYDHIVAAALEHAHTETSAGNELQPNDPKIVSIANTAYSPDFLQHATDTVLDSVYGWLEGKTTKPTFSIDLTHTRQSFISGLSTYAKERTASLPECTQTTTTEYDALTATCRPKGVTSATVEQQVNKDLTSDTKFLSEPALTADSFQIEENGVKVPVYTKLASAPQAYQLGRQAPFILAVILAIAAVVLVLVSPHRHKGFRKIGSILISASIGLLLTYFFLNIANQALQTKLGGSEVSPSTRLFAPQLTSKIVATIQNITLRLLLAYGIVGIAILIAVFVIRKRAKKPAQVSSDAVSDPTHQVNQKPEGNVTPATKNETPVDSDKFTEKHKK
jgi:hypothetical protein